MSDPSIETVLQLKSKLQSAQTQKKPHLLQDLLTHLSTVHATKDLLRESGIGIYVNHLKKKYKDDPVVAKLANSVLVKWKKDVGMTPKPPLKNPSHPSTTASSPNLDHPTTNVHLSHPHDKRRINDDSPPVTNGSSACSSGASSIIISDDPANSITTPAAPACLRSVLLDNVSIPQLTHSIRSKCVELLYNGLCMDSDLESDHILKAAVEIEAALYAKHGDELTSGYKTDLRIYTSSLKNRDLKHIRLDILASQLLPADFVLLKATDLVSNKTKLELEQAKKRSIFLAQGAANIKAVTEEFRCGKCGKRKCSYFQMQTRSADEPMTTFVECLECGNNWKFC